MPDSTEPFPVSDDDLEELASTLAKTVAEVRRHGVILDRLDAETVATPVSESTAAADAGTEHANSERSEGPTSVSILALDGEEYSAELEALTVWVNHLLLPVYGREISTTRPWCYQWHEHAEAVARLHALWLSWQQLTNSEAGLSGPSMWHRDHLDHTLLHLRAPDGPFAACTTSPARPNHRMLASPAPDMAGVPR
jgi:hypothetical protein